MNYSELLENFPKKLLLEIGLVLLLTIFVVVAFKSSIRGLKKFFNEKWLHKFLDVISRNGVVIILIYSLILVLESIVKAHEFISIDYVREGRYIFLVCSVMWMVFKLKNAFEKHLLYEAMKQKKKGNPSFIMATSKLFSMLLFLVSGLAILSILDVHLTAFYAFGGIGGFAISLAGKDVFANFFGGLMIYINQPFAVGDWIMSPNKKVEGVVEEVGWYLTRIRSLDRRPTYVPNSLFTDAVIENPGRMYNRKLKNTFSLRFQDAENVEKIVKEVKDYLLNNQQIDQKLGVAVSFLGFGELGLEVDLNAFTFTVLEDEFRKIQQEVFLKVSEIIRLHQAELVFQKNKS